MNKLLQLGLLILCLSTGAISHSQSIKNIKLSFIEMSKNNIESIGVSQIQANNAKYYSIDLHRLKEDLDGMMHREHENSGFIAQVSFPHPDGTFHLYNSKENSTMHPKLAEKFSEIKSYDGKGANNQAFVKWDLTPQGLHAMIMIPGESTIFIDPVIKGNTEYYIVYSKKDFFSNKFADCQFNSDGHPMKEKNKPVSGTVKSFGTCELRTYRLAVSATGEYTVFHGGTIALAQAAQVTTMNRVNGVFERDMAVTMVIVANNDLLVHTNPGTDPFTNGNPGAMINENQTDVNAQIGSANYDIGHVFGTNSGGLAGLGVVCNNTQKARGVTGSGSPIGDPFDIDYVAHEMGHQFDCNHTFNNSCGGNRNDATAVEVGSGNTIMAYAGICAPNSQNASDDHFSGKSLEEMGGFVIGGGGTCASYTPLTNNPPTISSTNANVFIPISTPFALTAVATDPDGDILTYNWEQMDNAISTQPPVATSTDGPNFISNPSLVSPTRYFPDLGGLYPGWEVLPSVTRTMNFRVTVRDNASGGACNDHTDVTITSDAGSGPFIVNYPSNTGITWAGLNSETVTWSVANTDVAPVACANVDILLSTDGGLTFPTVLASNVTNDGSQVVTVPNISTTTAIVMVICSNGTFYDVSDNNFAITMATFDYTLATTPPSLNICQPNDAVYTVDIGSVGGYNDPASLSVSGVPAGAIANFSVNPVTPVGQSVLTISNTVAAAPGLYTLTITASSTTGVKTNDVDLIISNGAPTAVTLLVPTNGGIGVTIPTDFSWTASPDIGVTYEIDIANDVGFASIVDQATGILLPAYNSTILGISTTYYWRVRTVTGCGQSAWSTTFSFTTNSCNTFASTDVPVAISATGTPTITSTLTIPTGGTITDVNVFNLTGQHSWINDLTVRLTSPSGTSVILWAGICNNENNFDVNFDDAAAPGALPCPPVGGGTYQPNGLLSAFNGENQIGVWTLTITDAVDQDGGSLNSWSLQVCSTPDCSAPDNPTITGLTEICTGGTTTLSIGSGNLNDAADWEWYTGGCGVTSAGSGVSITVTPGGSEVYYVRGEGGCVNPAACISVSVNENGAPSNVSQVLPADVATGVATPTIFTWNTAPEAGVTYEIDIATDPGFTLIADQATGLAAATYSSTILATSQTYYWRVRAISACGVSSWSGTYSFTTTGCSTLASVDTPILISAIGTPTITSIINIPVGGTINDVNVIDLIGTHSRVRNLIITLQSPLGTIVTLMDQPCNNSHSDFDVDYDDGAATGVLPCAPIDGNAYQPIGLLSDFNGEDALGTWILTIADIANNNGGELLTWSLEVCTDPISTCLTPELPITSGSASICLGSTTTLSVASGNLNDATDWTWYETACGGTPIGIGASIDVSPTTNTSYFVRGEGGCVVPGACSQVDVIVNSIFNESASVSICNGDSYVFGTQTLTAGGSFTELFSSTGGCDSTVVLTLTVNPILNETASALICDGDSYIFGTQTLTTGGSFTELFTSAGGCDSLVVLTLTVNPIFNETASASICNGDSYIFGTQTLTAAGSFTELFTSAGGCDSTVVLTLTVNPIFNETASASICNGDSYIFGTQTLTAAGSFTELFTSVGGCDSLVVLTLTVNPSYNETASATICNGNSFIFGSQTLTTAGSYTELFSSMQGCDSLVILTLDVVTAYNETANASICNGDIYPFGAQSLTTSGTYTELFASAGGCDSLVILTLDVIPTYTTTEAVSICEGETYTFPDGVMGAVTEAHISSLTSASGCDSTVITALTVNPSYYINEFASICEGSTYTFPDGSLGALPQTQTSAFTTSNGCDSIIVTTLIVNLQFNTTQSVTICEGDSYIFPDGTVSSTAQVYTSLLSTANGCDSVIVTTLIVNLINNETTSVTICAGETFTFPDGSTSTVAQTQTSILTNMNGCDSSIVTILSVQSVDVSVTNEGTILTANQVGGEYLWIDCANGNTPITGETGVSYAPISTVGNYAVIVTVGSCSDTSACILVDQTGIEELIEQGVMIYPNPASNAVNIEWSSDIDFVEITDSRGRLLKKVEIFNQKKLLLDITEFAKGVYFIHLESEQGRVVYDIIKH